MKGPLFFKTSVKGYRNDSPDKNEDKLKIPSNEISMDNVDFKVHGKDNLGNEKVMEPGKNYKFPGDYVVETPLYQRGCDARFRGSCRVSTLDKIKDWSRRKRLGDKFDDFTDFVGITDYDRDGNVITRSIDNVRRNNKIRKKEREERGPRDTWFRDADNDGTWFSRLFNGKKVEGCPNGDCAEYVPGPPPEGIVLEDDIWEQQNLQDEGGNTNMFA
jgi:hypothetical protein